ncbi:hypothetical protein OESDEN_02758 [Oesophagostomum dentatum]|uniref:Uncharacterized protein n=1 Tax=Oesophagostomum dentatum TaxID=61180 RepID=A0A0B1TIA0_OESDE|nr:hypothetical protein OESDEN_02758 [Oesophagostomum dentatum]
MLRIFRVADTTKHCGVNTKLACIFLGILVTAMEIYSFLFLPLIVGSLFSFLKGLSKDYHNKIFEAVGKDEGNFAVPNRANLLARII